MSVLSLIPHRIRRLAGGLLAGCGCGWVEHVALIGSNVYVSACRLGTLLGPEKTPFVWCFSVPLLAWPA